MTVAAKLFEKVLHVAGRALMPHKYEKLFECCCDVGTASQTVAQHHNNNWLKVLTTETNAHLSDAALFRGPQSAKASIYNRLNIFLVRKKL